MWTREGLVDRLLVLNPSEDAAKVAWLLEQADWHAMIERFCLPRQDIAPARIDMAMMLLGYLPAYHSYRPTITEAELRCRVAVALDTMGA